ncbi:MAG: hypothetical protein HGB29_02410 [Chlorobiaceae bacterium]|nr:hypothetical protein [Chlorobiaceae bacterium]NTW73696.1 hypothetical protein [Chlorobiaceae bacterium]HWR01206.1 hypothetical protein [Chlorobaculum sp.]
MNIAIKRIISTVAITQVLALSTLQVDAIAAPPFDALNAPAPASTSSAPAGSPSAPIHTASYFTDSYGNILMNVNIWGNVLRSGPIAVPEGADIGTAISLAGGPANAANLKKVRVNRASPDENGKITYEVNLAEYAKKGDQSVLLELRPNDTIIVPESKSIRFLEAIGLIATGATVYSVTR